MVTLLLLAGCGPALDSFGDTADDSAPLPGRASLPQGLVDALVAGDTPVALVQVDDHSIDATIAAARGPADRAGDLPDLLATRAELWADRAEAFADALPAGVRFDRAYTNFPLVVVELDDLDAARSLAGQADVVLVDEDMRFETTLTESLPLIGADTVAADGYTGAGTAVAVLDTGADYTVSGLGSCTAVGTPASCRVAYAADFATEDHSRDDNGHGTNVSAIVAGVATETDILALDVFRSDGTASSTDILTAMDWVVSNKSTYNIAAINMSLGSGGYTSTCSTSFSSGVSAVRAAGVSVVVASGNNGYTNAISAPACSDGALSVGAVYDANVGGLGYSVCTDSTTAADKVTCFSNSASFLDVLAPGAVITAGGYSMTGTSQASPHVAGAMAVLRGADSSSSVSDLEDKLLSTGDTITDTRNGYSFPRINLENAVADCVTDVSTLTLAPAAAGESGTLDLTTTSGCSWTIASDQSWLTTSVSSGTDSASLTWTAAANTGSSRTGHLTLSGRTITATQAADAGPTGTLSISGGASGTNTKSVSLTLSAADSTGGVSQMCISNSSTCSSWLSYATSYSWTLSSTTAGTKTVYVWFKDSYGNVSDAITDTIVYDATKPTNGTVSATGADGALNVTWTGFSDSGAGLSSYKVVYGTSSPSSSCASGTTAYTGSESHTTISGLSNGTTYYVRVCATDGAGNTSTGSTTSLRVAPEYTAPSGSITLNSGAAWTTSASVTVGLSATDDTSVAQMCVGTSSTSCSSWVTYATSTTTKVSTTAGTRTVYAFFKDPYGNTSGAISDTIGYDATAPSGGSVTATASSGQLVLSWSGFTDATSGVASYKLVYATTSAPSSCSTGTPAYTGSSTSATVTGLTDGTTYGFRVCAVDAAGNTGTGVTTTAHPAPELDAPTGTVSVDSGESWTTSKTLNLTLTANDASGVSKMCVSTSSTCSSWVTYASSTTTTVTSDGTKTAYVWLQDVWGNQTSTALSDSIGVDSTAPTNGTVTATASSGGASLSWKSFKDTTSGLSSYKVVYTTGAYPSSSCTSGTVAYSGSSTSTTLSGLSSGTKVYVRVCAIDAVGNTSTGGTTTVTPS